MKPVFRELATLKGWKYREVNVETCKSKICNSLEYVPTVFIGRRKLDLKEMDKMINEV